MIIRFCGLLKLFFALVTIFLLYNVSTPSPESGHEKDEKQEEQSEELKEIDDFLSQDEMDDTFTDFFINSFYQSEEPSEKTKKNDIKNLAKLMENYIHRYVSLLLKVSDLSDHKPENRNEVIKANIELTITAEELTFLQNYGKSRKSPSISSLQRDLFKLDSVMSKIAHVKEKHSFHKVTQFIKKAFDFDLEKVLSISSLVNSHILIFFLTIFSVYAISPSVTSNRFLYAIFVALNNIILYESYWIYQRRITEAEIRNIRSLEKPDSCDTSKRSWYHDALSYFREDPCIAYYRQLMMDPTQEVSLLQSVIDNYAFYFIEKPLQIFGKSSHALAKQYTSDLPWPLRTGFQLLVVHTVAIMGVVVILLLCGMDFRFSFLGTSVQMRKAQAQPKNLETSSEPAKPLTDLRAAEKALVS